MSNDRDEYDASIDLAHRNREFTPGIVAPGMVLYDRHGNPVGCSNNPLQVGPREAFGGLAVASPRSLFDSKLDVEGEAGVSWFEDISATGATFTHNSSASTATLSIGNSGTTPDGSRSIRRSRVTPYIPGHGKRVFLTFCFEEATAAANVQKNVGMFDDSDGTILRQTSAGVTLLIRDSTSGTVVETNAVDQADWDDPFDGTGPSGITADWSKRQILVIDLQWLGVGAVAVALDIDGVIYSAHVFKHANMGSGRPYMATAVLPVSYEIIASGAAISSKQDLTQICCSVQSFGTESALVQDDIASNRTTSRLAATTGTPVVSMRANSARVPLEPAEVDLLNGESSKSLYWELVFNGALTGASFSAASGDTHHDIDVSATAITGGKPIASGYVAAAGGGQAATTLSAVLASRVRLGIGLDSVGDTLSLVIYNLGTGTAACYGTIQCASYHG